MGEMTGSLNSIELSGELYQGVLKRFHETLKPRTYFEVGTLSGDTLALASCRSVAVDPKFRLQADVVGSKPSCQLFQMTSDAFFEAHDPKTLLGSRIDMAFLDGLHLFEFLLRDFMNTEKHCKKNSVIFLHDCVPYDPYTTARSVADPIRNQSPRRDWWAGDVWKIVPALKKHRADLSITVLDALPTGLVLISNLDPSNTKLDENYSSVVTEFVDLDLAEFGISNLPQVRSIKPTASLATREDIWKHFWL